MGVNIQKNSKFYKYFFNYMKIKNNFNKCISYFHFDVINDKE